MIAVIVVAALVGLIIINAAFLLWGAHIAGIKNPTFGKALGTAILGAVASFVISLVFRVAAIGIVIEFFCDFLIDALIMMQIFSTTYGKALGATLITWVGLAVVGGLILLAVAATGGLANFGELVP